MIRIALRNLWEHKLRTSLLGIAVVGGVAFVVASFVFTDSLSAAFDLAFEGSQEGIDVVVRPTADSGDTSSEAFPLIPADLLGPISDVDGVTSIRPNIQGFVTLVEDDEQSGGFAPDFVISWPEDSSALVIESGTSPAGESEVVVDVATFDAKGYALGDTLTMAGVSSAKDFELVGTFSFGGSDFGFGAGFFALEFETAAALLGAEGSVTAFDVTVDSDAELEGVIADINVVLPSQAEAVDARLAAEEEAAQLEEGIGFFNTFLLVFAGISLIVGAFVVYNAFRVVVAQRGKELALLRVLGTTRRQLVWSVLVESLVVGLVAALIGVGAGVVLAVAVRGFLEATGGSLPNAGLVVTLRTLLVGIGVGVVTTLVSAVIPALRTTRISPIEALRDQPELHEVRPWWAIAGGLVMVAALALVFSGIASAADNAALTGDSSPLILIGFGCLLAFVAVFVLARSLARPMLSAIGAPARSTSSVMGRENARRAPRRTAVTASALMVGVGLVATVAVLSQSVQDTIFDTLDSTFAADLLVQASGFDPTAGIPVEAAGVVNDVDGVEQVGRVNYLTIGLPGGGTTLALGVEPETIGLSFSYESVEGSFDDLRPNTIAVQKVEADTQGWEIGDPVELEIDAAPYPTTVVAIFDYEGNISDSESYYLAYEEVAVLQDRPLDGALAISISDDRAPEEVKTELVSALEDFPTVQVQTLSDLEDQVRSGLNAALGLVAGLLIMSVIVAIIGIVLTLYLAVFERTRETGMLRAIGMTRRQVRRMIRLESILIAVFGTILGLALGLFCGWALSVGIAGTGVSFGIPWVWIIAALVGALVTGVVAAVIPARSATRMNVLDAIAYE